LNWLHTCSAVLLLVLQHHFCSMVLRLCGSLCQQQLQQVEF
jgi:hypothetical protein